MDNLEELVEKINLNSYEVGSSYWVDVTHVNNPHSFFVRPTSFRMYTPVLNAYGARAEASQLQTTSMVIFKSKKMKMYIRGQIMFKEVVDGQLEEPPKYDIYALDYGFVEKDVKLKYIRHPHHSSLMVPATVIHCKLAACMPFGETFTEKAIEAMISFLGNEKAKMIVREKKPDILTVELINTCPDDIATMLALTNLTNFGCDKNMISRMPTTATQKNYFTYKQLKEGDVLHVRAQTGKSLKSFYVSEIDDYKTYLREKENFSFFSKKQRPLEPEILKIGMPVAALMFEIDNKYERAILTKVIDENKAAIQLIDCGKTYEVPIGRLKEMSEKFFYNPALAIYCAAEESQTWDNALHKLLYPGYEFSITIIKVGDKFNTPNIVNLQKCVPFTKKTVRM